MNKNIRSILFQVCWAVIAAMLTTSCATPKDYNYFQDLAELKTIKTPTDGTIRLQPNDQIVILVKSKNPEMGNLFNKGILTNVKAGLADQSLYMMGYAIDPEGYIDFPTVGKVKLAGLTRFEAQDALKNTLVETELLKDANVSIDLKAMSYTVMGEVNHPGNYEIEKDVTTLFEALGKAGDLSVYGRRDSITLIRQNGAEKKVYQFSMGSAKDIFASEAYYIQQNDVIYVKANDTRARQSKTPGNESRTLSFWLSLASVMTSIAVLLFK